MLGLLRWANIIWADQIIMYPTDNYEGAHYMNRHKWGVWILMAVALAGLIGCNQESPAGKATEAAGQAAVDAIKVPMDKARGVESTLEKSAERMAENVKETAQ